MLRLILFAIVAILVSERNHVYAEPTEAPETTDQAYRRIPLDEGPEHGCWTEWFDRDNPSGSGDWETLKDLRKENPGRICLHPWDIEAQTLRGENAPAAGDDKYQISPSLGFICKNQVQKDKECEDYRVRFRCSPSFCADIRRIPFDEDEPLDRVCLTQWFDRDNPSGTGDWELLKDLRKENQGQICEKPVHMEVVTTGTLTPAIQTGQIFHINQQYLGFVCRNMDQEIGICHDYKVRFGCLC